MGLEEDEELECLLPLYLSNAFLTGLDGRGFARLLQLPSIVSQFSNKTKSYISKLSAA